MSKKKKIIIGVIIGIIVIAFIIYKIVINDEETIENIPVNSVSIQNDIIVEIKGEVVKPNIYYMKEGDRIYDLIKVAGGYTSNADDNYINLAMKLTDEMVVYVPSIIKEENDNGKISINKAELNELMMLDGIGEAKAQSIIDYRESHGYFMRIEDIVNVPGISKTIFDKIKEDICI